MEDSRYKVTDLANRIFDICKESKATQPEIQAAISVVLTWLPLSGIAFGFPFDRPGTVPKSVEKL
jgi:hypothetical protein